jgi:membrane-associated phospholipid phosphatase
VKKTVLPFLLALFILVSHPISINALGHVSREQTGEATENDLPAKPIWQERFREDWDDRVPLLNMFHNIGWNTLGSFAFNYGINFAAAGLGTWLFVESGVDWAFRNFSYDHEALAIGAHAISIYPGWVLPFATPVVFYFTGMFNHDEKLQVTGLALVQSVALASTVHALLKLSTGRTEPYIINQNQHKRVATSQDFSNDFDWFKMDLLDGWPSGHTMSAFATAATIAQIYNDSPLIKLAAFSYAALMGAGVSLSVHWVSDVLAGALMGYAIGATVGRSFRQLLHPVTRRDRVSFTLTAQPLGILVKF